jgi:hypothetical protein
MGQCTHGARQRSTMLPPRWSSTTRRRIRQAGIAAVVVVSLLGALGESAWGAGGAGALRVSVVATDRGVGDAMATLAAADPQSTPSDQTTVSKLSGALDAAVSVYLADISAGAAGTVDTTAEEAERTAFWTLVDLVIDLQRSWSRATPGSRGINQLLVYACTQRLLTAPRCAALGRPCLKKVCVHRAH